MFLTRKYNDFTLMFSFVVPAFYVPIQTTNRQFTVEKNIFLKAINGIVFKAIYKSV